MISGDVAPNVDLRVDIAAPLNWAYSHGDTIIGSIIRKSPIVSPKATIKVWLTGIMRVRILHERGADVTDFWSDNQSYTNQWTLLDPTEHLIYSGPLHHPEDSKEPLSWPFAVSIPTKPRAYIKQGHQPQASFVPFDQDHKAYHVLPGSFRTLRAGFASMSDAVIEYRLHARLHYERAGSKKSLYATVPIAVKHALENACTDQFHISKGNLSRPTKVQSQRLLPDMENAELSFRQKTKKFFGSSKVPQFWFQILITSPAVVQFNNPVPLPISLSIATLKGTNRTSTIIEDIPQRIQINYMKIRIKSWTTVITPGNLSSRGHTDRQDFDVDLHFKDVFKTKTLENPLVIYSSDLASEAIHLGKEFELILRKDGLYANGRRTSWSLARAITPDLETFAIRHTHQFDFRVNLTVGRETSEVQVVAPVKILEEA